MKLQFHAINVFHALNIFNMCNTHCVSISVKQHSDPYLKGGIDHSGPKVNTVAGKSPDLKEIVEKEWAKSTKAYLSNKTRKVVDLGAVAPDMKYIVEKFPDVFDSRPGRTKEIEHEINVIPGRFDRNWDQKLLEVLFAIRNTVSVATKKSPAQMVYGKNLDLPWDANRTGVVVNDQELRNVGKYYRAIMSKNYDKTVPKQQDVETRNYRNNDPVLEKLDQRKRKMLEGKNDVFGGSEPIDTTGKFFYCNRGEIEGDFMVKCDRCRKWFHGQCVELTKTEADKLDTFC
ncbi:hypothetical protein A3Q56_05052 [Intoshia linei]|uniref:PHD-type domain-containing protein n=1 Tax=Intoshia linei TaxID=1819745 RepID=A0A177AYY0_9BILA|nr:hypothetical protein A3Q56_05052 [Intoshia linei]